MSIGTRARKGQKKMARPGLTRAQEIFPLKSFFSHIEFEDHCGNDQCCCEQIAVVL